MYTHTQVVTEQTAYSEWGHNFKPCMDIRHLDSQDIIQVFTHIPSVNEGHVHVQSLQKV